MVGRFAPSFNFFEFYWIFLNFIEWPDANSAYRQGHSAHGFSVRSLNSSRATFHQGSRPAPSSVRIWMWMCWRVFGGDKRSQKKLMCWLRKLTRQGRKAKQRNENWRQEGSDWCRALRTGLLALLRKVDLDEKIQCSPSDAKCNFVLILRTLSWAIGNALQLRASKEAGLDQESAEGWNNAMCVGVCLWDLR